MSYTNIHVSIFPIKGLDCYISCVNHSSLSYQLMEGGFAVANTDDARARRARRKEILRLKRNGVRALYPSVVSRSGCEYNFCKVTEFVL